MDKKIPTTFSLAGLNFRVKHVNDVKNGEDYGRYVDVENTIELANKVKDDDNQWVIVPEDIKYNTFWHELFHVFNYYWNTEFDESLAQVFANFMVEYEQTKTY